MNEQRINKADRLFDAIGQLDDRMIAEASLPPKKKSFSFYRVVTVTASFLVCVGILAGASVMLSRGGLDAENEAPDMAETVSLSLADSLMLKRGSASVLKVAADDLDLFGGKMSIIFKFSDESDYRVVSVSSLRAAELKKELLRDDEGKKLSPEESSAVPVSLWVCDGAGEVMSPYLEKSEGNVGYGRLFEYSPEIEPSEDLSELIIDLIS